jgi:hypothetical protein
MLNEGGQDRHEVRHSMLTGSEQDQLKGHNEMLANVGQQRSRVAHLKRQLPSPCCMAPMFGAFTPISIGLAPWLEAMRKAVK